MTFQTLPLSKIQPVASNPRKSFDEASIEGLAQSIKTDGLLQNLIVGKAKGKNKFHPIICGERRFRALVLLQEKGDLPEDYEVPVEIREGLSKEETHRIATMENVQRENLTPLEEAEAVAALLQNGISIEDVVSQTGLSEGVIKRRLVLSNLCEQAKEALNNGEITLSQAEVLTLATTDQQKELLEEGLSGYSVSQIKHWLTEEKANVAMALFDRAEYKGTYTSDLFAEDETTYFDDVEQFLELQEKAIEALAENYRKDGFDPVEIVEGYSWNQWKYRAANTEEGEKGGVAIEVHSSGRVEVHEGIVNRDLDEKTDEATKDNPIVDKKPKPTYTVPLMRYMAMHKSLAVQRALLENPRIMKEIIVAGELAMFRHASHEYLRYFDEEESLSPALSGINEIARKIYGFFAQTPEGMTWHEFNELFYSHEAAYDQVKTLSDEQLSEVLVFLAALKFGQSDTERLDTSKNSLFNKIAKDLSVDMRDYWRPDEAFLKRRNKDQLQKIILEAGCAQNFGNAASHKKKDLVAAMAGHFQKVLTLEAPNASELKAVFWLPEAMQFPAIDPDAKDKPEECDDLEDEEDYAQAA